MLNTCAICMSPGCYEPLSVEHREILESLVSKDVNLAELCNIRLLVCGSCLALIKELVKFRRKAIVGVRRLLHLKAMEKLDEPEQVLIKNEPPNTNANKFEPATLEIKPEPPRVPIRVVLQKLLKKQQPSPRFINPNLPQFLPYYNKLTKKINIAKPGTPAIVNLVSRVKVTNIPNPVVVKPAEPVKMKPRSNNPEQSPEEFFMAPRWYTRVFPYRKLVMARVKERARPEFENAPYKCTSCILVFESQEEVDAHAKEHFIGPDQLPCRVCALPVTPSEEAAHENKHWSRHQCARCGFSTEQLQVIEKHDCSSAKLRRIYKIKKEYHYPIKCQICHSRFGNESALERHKERKHSDPVEYKCNICNKKFSLKKNLVIHLRVHEKEKEAKDEPYVTRPELWCAECKIGFSTLDKYRAHRMTLKHCSRDNWKYECDICKRRFKIKTNVRTHIEFEHLMTRVSSCPECGKSIANPYVFRKHVRRHRIMRDRERPRPHVCELCGKAFMIKKSLTEHMFMHSGVRPYECKLCPATFNYSAALFTHNRLKHLKIKRNEKKKEQKKKQIK